MPVELFIARPATGKTQNCIHKVQEVLASSPLTTVWVVVPDRLQVVAFRQRLAKNGGVMGTRVGTFGDLYRSLLEHGGHYIPVASSPNVILGYPASMSNPVIDGATVTGQEFTFGKGVNKKKAFVSIAETQPMVFVVGNRSVSLSGLRLHKLMKEDAKIAHGLIEKA